MYLVFLFISFYIAEIWIAFITVCRGKTSPACQAEVDQLEPEAGAVNTDNIFWLDVQVDNASSMQVGHT